jgi:hypothetical protein
VAARRSRERVGSGKVAGPCSSKGRCSRSYARSRRCTPGRRSMASARRRVGRRSGSASVSRSFAVSFRKQVPVLGRFIVDLLAPEVRLIVEVDGLYHTRTSGADARRDRALSCDSPGPVPVGIAPVHEHDVHRPSESARDLNRSAVVHNAMPRNASAAPPCARPCCESTTRL